MKEREIAELKRTQNELMKRDEEQAQKIKKLESKYSSKKRELRKICKEKDLEIHNLQSHQSHVVQISHGGNEIQILDSDSIHSFDKVEEIGFGGSGKVYKVSTKVFYALKEMSIQESDYQKFKNLLSEYEIMNLLNHPNILKTYGIFLSDEKTPPSILLEYCTSNLEKAIKERALTKEDIIFAIVQISEGMKYIHFRKIIHRDLKPSNILIAVDGTIKISDFGISKLMCGDEISMTHNVGTQKFMAPEVINEDEDYNEKVDVYSFGILVLFILNDGQLPKIKMSEIFSGKKIDLPPTLTQFSKKLIESCLDLDPNNRPSFKEICQDIEKNNYNLLKLSSSELLAVKEKVEKLKEKIPEYDD